MIKIENTIFSWFKTFINDKKYKFTEEIKDIFCTPVNCSLEKMHYICPLKKKDIVRNRLEKLPSGFLVEEQL